MRDTRRERGDEITDEPLMRVKIMTDRNEVCITSNSIDIEYLTNICQLWGDAHAAVRKYMGWCVPSPVPSIDIDYEYAKMEGKSFVIIVGKTEARVPSFH